MAFTASVAEAAMTATAMTLSHNRDASVMVLVWNLGTAGFIGLLGSVLRRRLDVATAPAASPVKRMVGRADATDGRRTRGVFR